MDTEYIMEYELIAKNLSHLKLQSEIIIDLRNNDVENWDVILQHAK